MLRVNSNALAGDVQKVLVVGALGCGKSAYVEKLVTGQFNAHSVPTIGCENFVHEVTAASGNNNNGNNAARTTLSLWSCGGHPRFRPLVQQMYADVAGVLLFYDQTSEASFKELLYWHDEVLRAMPGAAMVLVGTKHDLSSQTAISAQDGATQAREWNVPHEFVSARTSENVDAVIHTLVQQLQKAGHTGKSQD
jgi:small GTP-binding protein